jgi:polar amino acid transport system permease protein
MTCAEAFNAYALRSLGYGERMLPTTGIGLCEQVVLIGSGLIWNVYFGLLALTFGFVFAVALAVAKNQPDRLIRKPAEWFIFVFRGSPLFIQFFMAYEAFVMLPRVGIEFTLLGVEIAAETRWFSRAWLGALIVLFLNTSAYAAEIFYGALRAIPRGDLEAADAYGLSGWKKFRRITFPTMMRLAWPSYTNEAIFLFHATALVFFSSFPAFQQTRRCALLRQLLRRPDLQPLRSLPDRGRLFRSTDAVHHRGLRTDQPASQPPSAAKPAAASAHPAPDHPMSMS